jgi:hypothetical protein
VPVLQGRDVGVEAGLLSRDDEPLSPDRKKRDREHNQPSDNDEGRDRTGGDLGHFL